MKALVRPAVALLVLPLPFATPATLAQEPSAQEVLALFEAASGGIWSYDVFIAVRETQLTRVQETAKTRSGASPEVKLLPIKPEERETKETFLRQVRQKKLVRIETWDGKSREPKSIRVSNGEAQKNVLGKAEAIVGPLPLRFVSDGMDYFTFFRTDYSSSDLVAVMRKRKGTKVYTESWNGTQMTGLDAPPEAHTSLSTYGFRVLLDPKNHLMPRVLERYKIVDGKPGLVKRTVIESFKKLPGGISVPFAARTTMYFPYPPAPAGQAAPVLECVATVDEGRSKWNREMPASLFDVEIPPGAVVSDRWRHVRYPAGAGDTKKTLDALAASSKHIVAKPVPAPEPSASGWPNLKIALIAGISLCALAGSLALVRAKVRRRQ